MKYFIYIVSFLYSSNVFSQTEMDISNDVEAGATDIQNATSLIEASNTIKNHATAVYKAGEYIVLNEGFFADAGSEVFMTIEATDANPLSSKNIESDFTDANFYVYPNPSNGILNIESKNNIISYSLNDLIGNQILSAEINDSIFTIDITPLPSGFYLLELFKENGQVVRKKIIKN